MMSGTPTPVRGPAPVPARGNAATRTARALLHGRLPWTVWRQLDRLLLKLGRRHRTVRADGMQVRVRRGTTDAVFVERILVGAEYTRDGFELGADDIVIDIGANIGTFTLHAAPRCARVVAYEPGSTEYALLCHNVAANGLGNVTAINAAVGGQSGTVALRRSRDSGLNTIRPDRKGGDAGTESVRCVTLERVMEEHGVERCDLLKLDCEGAEYEILYGAPASVLRRVLRITMVYHAGTGENKRQVADALAGYLQAHGFEIVQYIDFVGHDVGMLRAARMVSTSASAEAH